MLEGNICDEEQGNGRHETPAYTQKGGLWWMASGIDWTEKMFSIRHLRNAIPSAFKIAATKIGDDVESDICISHLRLTISH
jgi:hypothetical protein